MPLFPLDGHILAHDQCGGQHGHHGDQRKKGQLQIHGAHLTQGHGPKGHGIHHHKNAGAEAVLYGFQIVGEQRHQFSHLVDLIKFLRQILGMTEQPPANVRFHFNTCAKQAHTP